MSASDSAFRDALEVGALSLVTRLTEDASDVLLQLNALELLEQVVGAVMERQKEHHVTSENLGSGFLQRREGGRARERGGGGTGAERKRMRENEFVSTCGIKRSLHCSTTGIGERTKETRFKCRRCY